MDHGGLVLGISEWRMDHIDTEEKGSEWCLEEEAKVVNISYPNPNEVLNTFCYILLRGICYLEDFMF